MDIILDDNRINWSDKTILIVEDVETSNRYYDAALSRTQAKLLWAKNGEEAIEMVNNTEKIDIILMDLHMPKVNGFEATKQIKASHPSIPIIVQTAYVLGGEEEKSMEAGCDLFITKPVRFNKLIEAISGYF